MKRYFPRLLLLGCAALLAFGLERLFELRFATGDVYPAYSSLRADPLGTMAFYESLGQMPGLSVSRDFSTANQLPEAPGTVYLQLAANRYDWTRVPADLHHEIKAYLAGGGRLVITFAPPSRTGHGYSDDEEETNSLLTPPLPLPDTNSPPHKSPKKHKPIGEELRDFPVLVDLEQEWGLHSRVEELPSDNDVYRPVTVANRSGLALPATLKWHSGLVFTNCAAAWHTIYARGDHAVVLERHFGRGTVVVASDSFFLSNEALSQDRHADFLAWLIGPNPRVVFDESHFGLLVSPGIASLMRQYRLHGLAAGLLVLAGLFLWKNSSSLAPPPPEAQRDDFIAGKDSASGFVNLLRRNLPASEVLGVCFAEWKKSIAPTGKFSRARQQQAEAIFAEDNSKPGGQRDPLATYRKISETLGKHQNHL